MVSLKGQLISKGLFAILNSSKKRTKKIDFTTMIPQMELFSFVFWKVSKHQKDILKLTDLYNVFKKNDYKKLKNPPSKVAQK